MLFLPSIALPNIAAAQLAQWQVEIDQVTAFPDQVKQADIQFTRRNVRSNPTFRAVRENLEIMHGNLIRCAYCEDSQANQVEHLYPKNIYPNRVFDWENYTYACNICNGPKSNKFSVFRTVSGTEENITPPKIKPPGWVPSPPPAGDPLLLNPRIEDPMTFLTLDLGDPFTRGTYRLDPDYALVPGTRDYRRARYSVDEVLKLNRSPLTKARENAHITATAVLLEYAALKKQTPFPISQLDRRSDCIRTMNHRTVWKEMIRQRTIFPEIDAALSANPEVLTW